MQLVFFHVLVTQRLEGAEPHMQSDLCGFDAARAYLRQDFGREMQTRGWRGCRPPSTWAPLLRFGEYGLVTLAIGIRICSIDIRRQGHVTNGVNDLEEVRTRWQGRESQGALAKFATADDFSLK